MKREKTSQAQARFDEDLEDLKTGTSRGRIGS